MVVQGRNWGIKLVVTAACSYAGERILGMYEKASRKPDSDMLRPLAYRAAGGFAGGAVGHWICGFLFPEEGTPSKS